MSPSPFVAASASLPGLVVGDVEMHDLDSQRLQTLLREGICGAVELLRAK
jgi:hypothetical protein